MITRRQAPQTLIALSALPHVHAETNEVRQTAKVAKQNWQSIADKHADDRLSER